MKYYLFLKMMYRTVNRPTCSFEPRDQNTPLEKWYGRYINITFLNVPIDLQGKSIYLSNPFPNTYAF